MLGDTLFEGKIYSKIYENGWLNPDSTFNPATATYFAALREDSTKKVFVRTYYDTTDVLLYDFSLEVGDTFCFEFFSGNCRTVYAIDSILIDNSFRRTIRISDSEPQEWIEGIGNVYGLFDNMLTGSIFSQLTCFRENNELLYFYSSLGGCHCDDDIGIAENKLTFSSSTFPNPAINSATLEFENTDNTDFILQVFDIAGRTIIEQTHINTNRTQLNTSYLPPGIYHYRLASEQRQSFGKFVVI